MSGHGGRGARPPLPPTSHPPPSRPTLPTAPSPDLAPRASPRQVGIGRVLREHSAPVNSIDFSKDGELLASSGDDERLCLYSCQQGTLQKTILCRKHGVQLVRFTHDPLSVLVASSSERGDGGGAEGHAVRYLSLHDDRYLRAFVGHTARVTSLEISPKEDVFASAALDGTVRLWDLRSTNCAGVMEFDEAGRAAAAAGARPAVAFDPQGVVFAATIGGGQTSLFDVRATQKGPFVTFTSAPGVGSGGVEGASFSCLKFSNDGKLLLQSTAGGKVLLLDAFNGAVLQTFTGHDNQKGAALEASFSADAEFVMCGSEDGTIWRWHRASAQALPPLAGHVGAVAAVKCSPTRMMIASACSLVCLWLPMQPAA